jgi:hypothetical protein
MRNVLSHNEKVNKQQNIKKMENFKKMKQQESLKPNENFTRSIASKTNCSEFTNKVSNYKKMNINNFKRGPVETFPKEEVPLRNSKLTRNMLLLNKSTSYNLLFNEGGSDSVQSGKLVDVESDKTEVIEKPKYKDKLAQDLKYLAFFKPQSNYFDRTILYNKLYELLHEDIQQFNHELNELKYQNDFLFEELIANIETIIKNRFPGDH